jgi:hypothetical protein
MSTPVEIDAVQVVKDLIAERDHLRQQVAEQLAELARLRRELGEATRLGEELSEEVDAYRKEAFALLPKDATLFTEEDVAEWEKTGIPLEEFIHEIEGMSEKGPPGDTAS